VPAPGQIKIVEDYYEDRFETRLNELVAQGWRLDRLLTRTPTEVDMRQFGQSYVAQLTFVGPLR
jgi:hypothetical protein